MKRKPIQLAELRINEIMRVVAICDDGTMWFFDTLGWHQIESIPQA